MGVTCTKLRGTDGLNDGDGTQSARARRRERRLQMQSDESEGTAKWSAGTSPRGDVIPYHDANLFKDKDEKGNPVVEPLTKKDTIMYSKESKQQITNYRSPTNEKQPNATPTFPSTKPPPAPSSPIRDTITTTSTNTTKIRPRAVYTSVLHAPESSSPEAPSGLPGRVDSSMGMQVSIHSHNSSSSSPNMGRNNSMSLDGPMLPRYVSEHTLAPNKECSYTDMPSRDGSYSDAWPKRAGTLNTIQRKGGGGSVGGGGEEEAVVILGGNDDSTTLVPIE